MRVVRVLVPEAMAPDARTTLDDEGFEYVVIPEVSGDRDAVIIEFPVPAEGIDRAFELLADAGLDEQEYALVSTVETAWIPGIETLEERFIDGEEGGDRITAEEIRTKALEIHPTAVTYYAMTVLSAVVATAGLLLDSPAIVVGSMVIAPQVGSALLASVGTAIEDGGMFVRGLRAQVFGLALAVVGAATFGVLVRTVELVPVVLDPTTVQQIGQRISPGALSLVVAICAGSAGAFGLATALPVSLVGVMIAAALIPAAAAVGVGVAWSIPSVAAGAFVLLVMNTAAINLAGFATLRALGYRPDAGALSPPGTGTSSLHVAPTAVAVVVLVAMVIATGVPMARQIGYEQQANRAVEDVLSTDRYSELELGGVSVTYADALTTGTRRVTVTVSRPADAAYPALAARIGRRLARRTDDPASVHVVFMDRQRYETATVNRSIPDVPRRVLSYAVRSDGALTAAG